MNFLLDDGDDEMTVDNVLAFISTAAMEDLTVIRDHLRVSWKTRQGQIAKTFRIGDEVEFDAKGTHWSGKVVKVNRKTVAVAAESTGPYFRTVEWRVAPSMLRLT